MRQLEIILVYFLGMFVMFIDGCIRLYDDPTSVVCTENNHPLFLNLSNITQLSMSHIYLTEMPDLFDSPLIIVHLDNNQIQLMHRSYSTVEYLYLNSNHIFSLHNTDLNYPKLKYLDLSHNPIEKIVKNFFSEKHFPQLQILKLTNALSGTLLHSSSSSNHIISLSTLNYLNELTLDENDFDQFSCSVYGTNVQWELPSTLNKLLLGRNKLTQLDPSCFRSMNNLTELDLHYNLFRNFSYSNSLFPRLSKLKLDYNLFTHIPTEFLQSLNQLTELDMSTNQLNFTRNFPFPSNLRILYLNSMTTHLTCSTLNNLNQLEELHFAHSIMPQLDPCVFKKLINLQMLNLRDNHLVKLDEFVIRPLLLSNNLREIDLTSDTLRCDSCSLRWLIEFLKDQNRTRVTCLDSQGIETLINTFDLSPCTSTHFLSRLTIILIVLICGLLSVLLVVYTYRRRKILFTKLPPVYHMVPLRQYDRIYQNTTEDFTGDNIMLVNC